MGLLFAALIILLVRDSMPKVVYQPVNACTILSPEKAKQLLGERTVNSTSKAPVLSGNTAISNCGYTDGNPDTENMTVIAAIVRSGVNDKGVAQNTTEFKAGMPAVNATRLNNIGDAAYFNESLGQLNVLHGRQWIILSYGPGAAPQFNTVDDALTLAHTLFN